MTLRARLLIALGGLLAAALVVAGGLVVGITRASLVDDIDRDLRTARAADIAEPAPPRGDDPTGRRFALLVYNPAGELLEALPSSRGFGYPADPLPAVTAPAADGNAGLLVGRIVDSPAVDGSFTYRVLALSSPRGATLVLAAPMRGVDASIAVLVRTLAVVGAVVLGLMVVLGWFIIRRDLHPLEQMTGTAERISAGDLGQRVGVADDGSEVGRLGHAFDAMLDQIQAAFVSQQAALEAKQRSEAQLRQFVADASHELRTPLTALRGYAELFRAGGLDERDALEQAMSRIGSESRRMAALVEDLLLLARLDQGRPLRHEPTDLTRLVEDALGDMSAVEPSRPVRAELEDGVIVVGDEDRLRQLIGNLFSNVRVHTAPETPVDVALSATDGVCSLVVADHGPGVDAAHVERIFDRFYRADSGRSRDRGGSGLGLSIAASVAAAHAGSLACSATPGGGATFTLTLPRAQTGA